jgi:hypothetical protein
MSLLTGSIQLLGKGLPKVIPPKGHAIADYSVAALFLASSALFWKQSKRAAIASLICGVAEAGVAALTDYPGGLKRSIIFPLHKQIDLGLASMVATMPAFLAFDDERETAFFRVQSAVIAGVTALTDFGPQLIQGEEERRTA